MIGKSGSNRAKFQYWVNVTIGVGFLLSAISGFVLLAAGSRSGGGYQGGRNPDYVSQILLLSRETWKTLHNWSSIVMTAGVAIHLALHAKWIVKMTKNIFRRKDRESRQAPAAALR